MREGAEFRVVPSKQFTKYLSIQIEVQEVVDYDTPKKLASSLSFKKSTRRTDKKRQQAASEKSQVASDKQAQSARSAFKRKMMKFGATAKFDNDRKGQRRGRLSGI